MKPILSTALISTEATREVVIVSLSSKDQADNDIANDRCNLRYIRHGGYNGDYVDSPRDFYLITPCFWS